MTLFGRRFSGLALVLVISLCLNVFALASFAGHWIWGGPRGGGGREIGRLLQSAPESLRPAIKESMESRRPEMQARIAEIREARQRIALLLRAPQLDRPALEDAYADLRRRHQAMQEVLHGAFIDSMAQAPADARAEWSERWTNRRQ